MTRKLDTERGDRRALRWAGRVTLGAAALAAGAALLGMTYQSVAERRDMARYAAPGAMVETHGIRLHLNEMGSGHEGPVVILEAGGGSFSAQWAWVQPAVAEFARVVSYDRPGLGWSDPATEPLDGTRIAEYLHAALREQGIEGPYIHVGHSVGSPLGRAFARRYPNQVVGMVKVDPRYLRTEEYLGDSAYRAGETMKSWLPLIARLGIPRLLNAADDLASGLPPRQREEGIAFFSSTRHLTGMSKEWDMGNRTTDVLAASGEHYGDLPIVILSSEQTDGEFDQEARRRFTALQVGMTGLSTEAEHRLVAGADHFTIVTEREHAAEVTAAIRDLVDRVRDANR
jgi:pimeloyl-ACP methyl ester carboxylesterase